MDLRVLGPVQVWQNETALFFPRRQQRLILGILAVEANHLVPLDRLIDLLWSDHPPKQARAVVQTRISELRAILAAADRADVVELATHGSGYLLQIDSNLVDAHRFRALVKQARAADSDALARDALRTATQLWHGPALGGWLPRDSHTALCHGLESERITALEDLFDFELRLGRHQEVVDEILNVFAGNPIRERLAGQVMLALHRTTRTPEALQAYDRHRRLVGEELGIDPGSRLQELHVGILRADPGLAATSRTSRPPSDAIPAPAAETQDYSEPEGFRVAVPRILPGDIPDFTGRESVTALLIEALTRPSDGVVVAAVAGPAGVGKSALCVHAAHRLRGQFPHGQLYVDLHGVDRADPPKPGEVLARFLRALGVESALPDALDERAELYRGLLAGRQVLIVLDNARNADQIRPLIPGSPTCAVLINSRARLAAAISGEAVDLEVLPAAEAVRLLSRIAGEDRVDVDPPAAERLAQLCGGLPLALRIAAGRLVAKPHWSVRHLVDRLADERQRLDQLAYGQLDVRTSIALSYTGMSADARRLLCRLGNIDLPEVNVWSSAALLDTHPADAEETLEQLHDAQLIAIAGQEKTGHARYHLHDLVRLFAKERATADEAQSELTSARRRAFGAWLYLVETAYSKVYGGSSENITSPAPRHIVDDELAHALTGDPLSWFDSERQTIVALIHRSARDQDSPTCWGLVCSSFSLFEMRRHFEECQDLLDAAGALATATADDLGQAAMLYRQGTLSADRIDREQAMNQWRQAAELFQRAGDRHGQALATFLAATLQRQQHQTELALGHFHQAVVDLHDSGDYGAEAFALRNIGQAHLAAGNYPDADAYLERALALARHSKSGRREAQALFWQGMLRVKQHRHDDAEAMFIEVLALARMLGDHPGQIQAHRGLGLCHKGKGDLQRAEITLQAALQLASQPTPTLLETKVREELASLADSRQ